jgi:hypothetical protein
MPSDRLSRRRLLGTLSLGAVAGCLSDADRSGSPTTSSSSSATPSPDTADGTLRIASLSVADFVLYALVGAHPHVHRRADTLVRADTSLSPDEVRERLTLELDGESASLAERQPVPWERETVDLAFAVSKSRTVDAGRVLFDGTVLRTLSPTTVERLNAPPVFEVGEPSVSPSEIAAGDRVDATVRVAVANTGTGAGTFGASLGSSYLSGSRTLTTTLDPGAERDLTGSIPIVAGEDPPTVRLDWGTNEWTTTVSVVGTATRGPTSTSTPAPK